MPSSPVAVVTDSTAYLPPGAADKHGVHVVPLEVRLGERTARDGVDVSPAELITALADRNLLVQTSRPAPASFAAAYREILAAGAEEIVSVHLSGELSGTWEAARAAAQEVAPDRIRVVDSRTIAMGLGFAVLTACDVTESGADGATAAAAAAAVAARCRVLFAVQDLERLRRGGRIGAASALVGGALAIKPVLHLSEGRIAPLEKVRTAARATDRLVALALAASGGPGTRLAVHHLGAEERAEDIADRLREQLPDAAELHVSEVGAVIGAHAGPGLVGVVVVPAGS
ncbi:DegV family protein [Pseudonocardia sp. C8]|uniref:DegV family protein n=1 Tax=Pseudonocardia sp. C8 TaxID=2762759 RepID=UPI0016435C11|nr:DegV family protein [Pseudonocardia sp. C8]